MNTPRLFAALVACLLVGVAAVRAEEPPSFKKSKEKDTKEFQKQAFEAIVHAARAKPADLKFDKGEYTVPTEGRKLLTLKGSYKGTVSKKVFEVEIKIKIDTLKEKEWEVLSIDYTDKNTVSLAKPNKTKIDALIPKMNK